MKVPFSKPALGAEECTGASRAIQSGWVTQGPEVLAFENEFAAFVGAPHAAAVSNCTTALHLALLAAGVGPGDEVITVSHSYIATANSIRYCGATPVFVDIDADTLNISPARVSEAFSPKTKAILCVHQIGMPCDLAALVKIAHSKGVPLIEDAACAIGSEILWNGAWEKIGRPHGDAACFSFHPRKLLTTGDGGMITTRHGAWDAKFRLLRQHAMSIPDTVRHASSQVLFEQYPEMGFNYRLTDIQAAVGRAQLGKIPAFVARRKEQKARYEELLRGSPLKFIREPQWARCNWQTLCLRLPVHCDQQTVMQAMLDRGIATRRGVMNAHREPAYGAGTYRTAGSLQNSEQAQDNCLLLPLFHEMTAEQQTWVVEALHASITGMKSTRRTTLRKTA